MASPAPPSGHVLHVVGPYPPSGSARGASLSFTNADAFLRQLRDASQRLRIEQRNAPKIEHSQPFNETRFHSDLNRRKKHGGSGHVSTAWGGHVAPDSAGHGPRGWDATRRERHQGEGRSLPPPSAQPRLLLTAFPLHLLKIDFLGIEEFNARREKERHSMLLLFQFETFQQSLVRKLALLFPGKTD